MLMKSTWPLSRQQSWWTLARPTTQLSPLEDPSMSAARLRRPKNLSGRHSLELLQRGINRVPGMAADAVCDHLRIELAWVVKAGRVDRYQVRHCCECEVDRRSTGRAEGVDLFVPAIARYPPAFRFARNCHVGSPGEGQIGSVTSAASFLAISTLAMVLEDGFAGCFKADRAAGASAGVGLRHDHSSSEMFPD